MDRGDRAMALSKPHVLIVAGSDCSGGAGIARDIETLAGFGLRAALAVTAVTVQTHDAVRAVELCEPGLVEAQMRAALEANRIAAIKIGMLGSRAIAERVAGVLADHAGIPVVLDPVIASSSGRPLIGPDALDWLRENLMPLCALVTPNLPELALLSGSAPALTEAEIGRQAKLLLAAGTRAILAKGGHAEGTEAADLLFRPLVEPLRFTSVRLQGSRRGTGCMLASGIAAGLATGKALETAIAAAKKTVSAHWCPA
ncbi:phosphomethylpyrimidine kinase [Nitratireductor indicus C115]|uniref:hydroxymethylpyrimidine kinase n=2 Tax=Nitratireductor indicus TaxID=721133 RepID=K2PPJ7_9HYPH|nr:hydroxymethylpyrimidine/phosphomethylpyrimidine kinase [Nitratireductor indicus]EKF42997.1 phosphomethylpyrimidine kinase [Nitratireductor indicus C115]SFQ51841.1 hydroxymethylpyrimidine/phosphomethylpyrimidine kinase [Nitratireductor indicus]